MIPVGVGRGLVSSSGRIVEQELQEKKRKKTLASHEVGRKGWVARFLLGVRF